MIWANHTTAAHFKADGISVLYVFILEIERPVFSIGEFEAKINTG
jgi:hypothetical protein